MRRAKQQQLEIFLDVLARTTVKGAALLTLGAFVAVISPFIWKPVPVDASLEQRIKTLTESLNSSVRTITQIEQEIAARQKLVQQLKTDAEIAQNLSSLNQKQTQAVAQTLRGQLEQRERESYWWNIAQNVFFAFLGVAFAEMYRWVVRIIRRRRNVAA